MNRFVKYFFAFAALAVALCGCAGEAPSSPASSAPEEASSQGAGGLSPEEEEQITQALEQMVWESSLTTDWVGWPEEEDMADGRVSTFEILAAERDGGAWWVTAELYGSLLLDPDTMTDTTGDNPRAVVIRAEGDHAPFLAFGTARVELRQTEDGLTPLSCDFEGYDGQPGLTYLKERTRELEAELSASSKIDPSQYDPLVVNYVWRQVLAFRYLESPADITLWDMEHYVTDVVLGYATLAGDGSLPANYVVDSEIFRLATGMEFFSSYYPLTDYSVFEGMDQLESVFFSCDSDYTPDFSSLKTGSATHLAIKNFQKDFSLDLTGSQVENLELHSYVAGVTGFAGCETVESLSIQDTRTDMALINAEAFPSLTWLDLNIYSDTPRFRDFSQLATFGEDVEISLSLSYQACNDDTLRTLAGVRLDSLYLDPYNGQWPLGDPDPEILAQIDAEELTVAPAPES